ncbi:MAG: proline--tRNA ligase [Candidatus Saccharimonadales bacterium]
MNKEQLPEKTGDLSDWYTTLIRLADLADYGPAKGTMIIKPYGYAIWENIQSAMNPLIKERCVENAYFPLFIPISFLEREKDHVEGFAPELAVVTHGGGEELQESLVVRPTSETIMYDSYSRWIQSWRDLPLMLNQWCNVVRWEKRTMPFIRTSEFLWQEGHTAHATHEEAKEIQEWAMDMYAQIYREHFAIEGYVGYKSTAERFAGADTTLTFESMMPSGKSLQAVTSHDLGQNFSKGFDIKFQNKDGGESYVWQTSWGLSTRSVGGLILMHGDNNGLRLPPKLAPTQVVFIPVKPESSLVEFCNKLASDLKEVGVRCKVDSRDDESFGFKINKWEVKGVPIICKVGDREVSEDIMTVKRRDTSEETIIGVVSIAERIPELLDEIQQEMFNQSKAFIESNTREAKNYEEFKQILAEHKGFIRVCWNDNPVVEKKIKEETKAKSSCRPINLPEVEGGIDFYTGEPAKQQWLFSQSY